MRFNHLWPTRDQHALHSWVPSHYGATTQFTEAPNISEPLLAHDIKLLQLLIGGFLHYARIFDSTMLVTLGTLASAQSEGAAATMRAAIQLLIYAATHPDTMIR